MEVCRLCLLVSKSSSYSKLTDPYKCIVNSLIPEVNLDITINPSICHQCSHLVNKLHEFKLACFECHQQQRKQPFQPGCCHTCSRPIENPFLQDVSDVKSILQFCMPEMDFHLPPEPEVCRKCLVRLQRLQQLKTSYLTVEEKLNSFVVDAKRPIDLGHLVHGDDERRRKSKLLPNILHSIGNTPMVKLNKIPQSAGIKANVYVKCEYFNPGGSVKDRIGFRMVEDAERQGLLKPGYTIIEPTSGNTGIGLALAAAVKGYRCIVVMSEKMSNEKVSTLRALGAEIVRTPVNLDSFAPGGMFGVTHELHKTIPNSVILDQYSNPGNPLAHYDTTAEEIYDQCNQQVAMIVIGAGTGGTVCGIGRKFKEISPRTKIVAADPQGSVLALPDALNQTDVAFYEVEGIGYDFLPTILDRSVVDLWVKTLDAQSLPMARRLIREEGLLCGSSSGANVVAALEAAKGLQEGENVVVILPDSIRNYMTKFVADEWMQARGLMPCDNTHNHWWWSKTIADLQLPALQVATTSMTADKVLHIMKKLSVDQMPVVDTNGCIVGMVTPPKLLTAMMTNRLPATGTLESHIVRVYPKLYDSASLGLICSVLEKEPYVVMLKKAEGDSGEDKPVAIVTPMDVLPYISGKPN